MADYDAQIRLIVSGTRQINELESSLNRVQDLLEELNDLGANAVFGRATNLSTYRNAIAAAQGQAAAIQNQVRATQSANTELRQQALLYSQLNREQALYRRRSTAFTEESRGVRETNQQVIELTTQLRTAQRAFSAFFADADLRGARTINAEISSILEQLREINRVATGTKNVGANTAQLQAQADGWNLQIRALRRRASALEENEEILGRLQVAERNLLGLRNQDMTFRAEANVRLGKQELANAEKLLRAEENIASTRRRDAIDYERQLTRQSALIANLRSQALKTVSKAGAATLDALTFGRGSQTIRGARNAAIRGGIGLGALGVGKIGAGLGAAGAATAQFMSQGPQSLIGGPAIAAIEKFNQVLNSALGGIPDIVAQAIQALGQIPDSLGLAAVAALAFAPAASTAAKSVFNLGKAAGNTSFGRPVASFLRDVNPLAKAAYGSVEALQQGLDRLRGQTFDIQEIAATASAVTQQLNESYRKLPAALPAAGETSFRGAVEYDPRIGAFAGGGARRAIENAEFLTGEAGTLVARSREAADATLLFAQRLGTGASEAAEAATRLEQGAQSAKRIAEYLKQAQDLRQGPTETSTQRFIREAIERGRRARQDEVSAQIARERSATLLGGQYSVSQVPARGELFPGGRTETRQQQYRDLLNAQAIFAQRAKEVLDTTGSLVELERRLLGGVSERVAAKKTAVEFTKKETVTTEQLNEENQRSVQIIRERNRELRQRPIAAMTPGERVQAGVLDPASLRQQRLQRVRRGRDLQERGGRALSEGLVGGAFPLLFGQGLGAAIGGGLGGAVGGFAGGGLGFGLSLAGTGLGSIFDTTIQSATDLGAALNDVSATFDKAKERALFSSREIEKYATRLQESGAVASASALAQQEIIKKIGASGVQELRRLESQSDKLNRAWAELTLQLQVALAGPMADLLSWVAKIVEEGNKTNRREADIRDIRNALPESARKELDSFVVPSKNTRDLLSLFGIDPVAQKDQKAKELAFLYGVDLDKIRQGAVKSNGELVRDEAVSNAQNQIEELNTQLEAIDIGKTLTDQLRDVARQQEDLNQQAFDARRQYEEAIGDIRLSIERTVQRESLDSIRAQNELYQVQGEIRLQQLSNANQALISEQGVNDYGRRLFEILGQAASLEVSTQQDIENRKRQFQFEMQSKELEAEIFKADIVKQVAKLNEDTQRRIADINKGVRRSNEQYDLQRFQIEKRIAELRMSQIQAELDLNKASAVKELEQVRANPSDFSSTRAPYLQRVIDVYDAQANALKESKKTIESIQAPPRLQEVGGVATQGASTAAYDAAIDRARALSKALLEANEGLISLVREGKWGEIKDQFVELADQGYKAAVVELQDIVEAVRNGGDAFAGAAARLAEADKQVTESLNSIGKQSETDLVKKYREGGLTDEQTTLLLQLAGATNVLARAQLDATQTAKFYSDSISAVQSKIQSLTEEIKEATTFGTNYEKALQSLASRGLSLADKEAQALIQSAKNLDILEEKAAVLNGIKTASEGLSGSMRGLIENFYELGSASEALKAFNEEISKKAVGLVLDIAFRPVEENIRKSLIMFGEKIGFDFSTPAEKQLTELQTLNKTIGVIRNDVNSLVQKIVSTQPAPAATSTSPGAQAAQVATGPVSQRVTGLPVDYVNSVVNGQSPQIKARLQSATTVDEALAIGEAIKREYLNTVAGFNIADPAARSQLNKLLSDLVLEGVKNRADEIRGLTGQGGPIDDRGAFPMAEDLIDGSGSLVRPSTPIQQPVPVYMVPGPSDGISPLLNRSGAGTAAASDLQKQTEAITQSTTTAAQSTAAANTQVSETIRKSNAGLAAAVPQWGKNLAGVVTSLSLAATGVVGILGGIQQIKEGGTGNILSGIGGILTTVGSIGLSVAGMFSGGAGAAAGSSGGGGGIFSIPELAPRPFAKGGVVKSPTLFQFANGGQFGVMGEAGAEAVMPLRRGPDGRLGVEQVSDGDGGSSRLREAMGRSPAQGGQASEFRIKFETTVINGVEYVSRDQLDQAMEQTRKASISEGAKRGMGMTLDKLKQSPSTRSRVGIR